MVWDRPLPAVVLLALLWASGCPWWNHRTAKEPFGQHTSCALPPEASKEELIAYLNRNIRGDELHTGLTSWRCNRVEVQVKGFVLTAPATIVVEAPLNFRLRVSNPMTNSLWMDLGSNAERFWIWGKDDPQQAVTTCLHEDLSAAMGQLSMSMPFHPEWLMEVLGVVPLDPAEFRIVRPFQNGPLIDLVAERNGPTGEPVQRVIRVNACHGIVLDHELRTANGVAIARAHLTGHYKDPATGITLPKKIQIDWPERDTYIVMHFREIDVNPVIPSDGPMFALPNPPGSRQVDLGELARMQIPRPGRQEPGRLNPAGDPGYTATAELSPDDIGSEAPPWPSANNVTPRHPSPSGRTGSQPAVKLSLEDDTEWSPPGTPSGSATVDEPDFQRPTVPSESQDGMEEANPFLPSSETIRMQSPGAAGPAPGESRGFNFWDWFRPRREFARQRPAAYSAAASRSSLGRLPRAPE